MIQVKFQIYDQIVGANFVDEKNVEKALKWAQKRYGFQNVKIVFIKEVY